MVLGVIVISYQQAMGLREAIRPLNNPPSSPLDSGMLIGLHERILLVLVEFETKEPAFADLTLTREDCLFLNQFLSVQDGEWAGDVLKQARRAMYELRTGVLPAWAGQTAKLWAGVEEAVNEDASARDSGAD